MSAPPASTLDANQCIQGAYDESKGRLRTTGEATIVNGALEVYIQATDDNIAIRNSNNSNELLINGDGSINVNATVSGSSPNVNIHDAAGNAINSTSNALNVAVQGNVNNNSVGLTGVAAPTSATEMGAVDSFGVLQPLTVDPSGKLLVDITGTSTVTGTVNASIEGLNSFQTSQYTVGTSAVQLTVTPLTNRSSMSMKAVCTSNNYVYIGNSSGVTTSTGYILFNGDSLQLDLTPAHVVYAIASAAAQTVYVLEIGS